MPDWAGRPVRAEKPGVLLASLAEEAHAEALQAFGDAPDSADKRFLLELPYDMVERDT
jgi:hypothetical protein